MSDTCEQIGLDQIQRQRTNSKLQAVVMSIYYLGCHSLKLIAGGLGELFKKFQSNQTIEFNEFKQELISQVDNFLETSLISAESQLNVYAERQNRLIGTIEQLRG